MFAQQTFKIKLITVEKRRIIIFNEITVRSQALLPFPVAKIRIKEQIDRIVFKKI